MSRIERFEDLLAWQKARERTRAVYKATRQGKLARDFGLSRQTQRAAVSVMSDIAEGLERNGSTELHQFLSVAKASCAELRSQLYVALDVGYVNRSDFDQLLTMVEEAGRIIGGLGSAVARMRDTLRRAPGTQHSALSTQHSEASS